MAKEFEQETEIVKCSNCAKEIPESAAISAEGLEYVLYFCGQACLDHWAKEHEQTIRKGSK